MTGIIIRDLTTQSEWSGLVNNVGTSPLPVYPRALSSVALSDAVRSRFASFLCRDNAMSKRHRPWEKRS